MRTALRQGECERGWLTEQFELAMQQLLQVQRNTYREVESLPAVRASTREELYRRVHYAKDYADAMCTAPITLTDIADVAGFSPNHLLRTFKTVFGQTPYQYLTMKRLEYARKLLVDTDQSITDICSAVGFESIGAFSWMFHRRVGVSPLAYRRQNR
jgi:AraC-like DNA-binding protein